MQNYDIAAFIWPSYTGDEPRSRMFWGEGMGEWQSVKNSAPKANGYHWNRKPLWGYVNEADPYVMESQISCAHDHGVNVFIYDWYWYDRRPFLEQCLNNGYLKAKNNDLVKFYLMWANHDANHLWNIDQSDTNGSTVIWEGSQPWAEYEKIVHRVIENYFSHPSYYKINGCPVFMIYDLVNLVKGLGGVDEARRGLEYFREETVKAGFPGLHLQATAWRMNGTNLSGVDSSSGLTKAQFESLGFDSITHYQFVHFTSLNRDYSEVLGDVKKEYAKIDENYDIPYFPHVSVGWDNNPRYRRFIDHVARGNTPEMFEAALRQAKDYADSHPDQVPLITVNSWNEWTETSYLEPDNLYGYGYLEAIKRVFK
nr:glycoside hydrolase family 99-like domain-containing protein [Clostridia bacterium]